MVRHVYNNVIRFIVNFENKRKIAKNTSFFPINMDECCKTAWKRVL